MKKILIFSTTYHPFVGGAEVAIKEITDRLPEARFDMITLRFDRALPRREKIGNITVHRLGFSRSSVSMADLSRWPLKSNKFLFPFLAWFKALSLERRHSYDLIWAMMAAYAGFGALFFKLTKPRIKYLLTLQEGDPLPEILAKTKWVRPLFRQIFLKADTIQAISKYLGQWARDMGYRGELKIVPNAVDFQKFSRPQPATELIELKKKLGKQDSDLFLVTASRLVKKNAVDDVIKALPLLPANYKFLVLGDGPDRPQLEALAAETGVGERVKFLGFIEPEELPKYLQVCDIFIRPSLSEGFGNSFVEAMAADLPVIATPVGGITDFIFDPSSDPDRAPTGIFCQAKDPASIADRVKWLAEHPAETQKIKANARAMVAAKYDWQVIAGQMSELIDNI